MSVAGIINDFCTSIHFFFFFFLAWLLVAWPSNLNRKPQKAKAIDWLGLDGID
jgi:hypothetical protein